MKIYSDIPIWRLKNDVEKLDFKNFTILGAKIVTNFQTAGISCFNFHLGSFPSTPKNRHPSPPSKLISCLFMRALKIKIAWVGGGRVKRSCCCSQQKVYRWQLSLSLAEQKGWKSHCVARKSPLCYFSHVSSRAVAASEQKRPGRGLVIRRVIETNGGARRRHLCSLTPNAAAAASG